MIQIVQYQVAVGEAKMQELYALLVALRYVQEVKALPTNIQIGNKMQTFHYQITIDETKVQELCALLQNLRYVQDVKVLPVEHKKKKAKKSSAEEPYYTPNKSYYSPEEIWAIAKHFPRNKRWKRQDLEKYFPPDLKVKVEIINGALYIDEVRYSRLKQEKS